MVYQSTVTFTMDAVCPWTYLAKKRLDKAIETFKSSELGPKLDISLQFHPFQLFPELPAPDAEPLDRGKWYNETKFNLAPDPHVATMAYEAMLTEKIGELGLADTETVKLSRGVVQSSVPSLATIWYVQDDLLEGKPGASEKVSRLVDEIYASYFRQGNSPSSPDALAKAIMAAGLDDGKGESKAKEIVEDATSYSGMRQAQNKIREVQGNGIDAVPVVMIEGRRRDVTLVGAKEVSEYIKALETVAKES